MFEYICQIIYSSIALYQLYFLPLFFHLRAVHRRKHRKMMSLFESDVARKLFPSPRQLQNLKHDCKFLVLYATFAPLAFDYTILSVVALGLVIAIYRDADLLYLITLYAGYHAIGIRMLHKLFTTNKYTKPSSSKLHANTACTIAFAFYCLFYGLPEWIVITKVLVQSK